MVLPLYLALTAAEISASSAFPDYCAYMACHFSPYTAGISNIPAFLPRGSMLILNDRLPCQGHSADLVAGQLMDALSRLGCESILLDFQRPPGPEAEAIVSAVLSAASCPVAVTEAYAGNAECAVFLSPGPLHISMEEYLAPWKNREVWLEAALCQESVVLSAQGSAITPIFPTEQLSRGFYDDSLRCCYQMQIKNSEITFTLFDTQETLGQKVEFAHSLGVTRAVGLWQELKPSPAHG